MQREGRTQFPPHLLAVIHCECEVCRFYTIHLAEGFFLPSDDISEYFFDQLCIQVFIQIPQTVEEHTLAPKEKN